MPRGTGSVEMRGLHNEVLQSYQGVFKGGQVVRWYWGNFQCWGDPLIWIIVGQGPTALAVGAGGDIFTLVYLFTSFSPSLLQTA